jgi:hypothetical protein
MEPALFIIYFTVYGGIRVSRLSRFAALVYQHQPTASKETHYNPHFTVWLVLGIVYTIYATAWVSLNIQIYGYRISNL